MTTNVDDEALSSILLHLKQSKNNNNNAYNNGEDRRRTNDNHNSNYHSGGEEEEDEEELAEHNNINGNYQSRSYEDVMNENYKNAIVSKRKQQPSTTFNDDYSDGLLSKKSKNNYYLHPNGLAYLPNSNATDNMNQHINMNELRKYFHLPLQNVSKKLGVGTTVLKRICRANNIEKWPYRQIKSLTCAMQSLEMAALNRSLGDDEIKNMREQIICLQDSIAYIIANPSILSK
jgi:hypothetical protein